MGSWKVSHEYDRNGDSISGKDDDTLAGLVEEDGAGAGPAEDESWLKESSSDAFERIDREFETKKEDDGGWETAEEYKPWTFEEEGEKDDVFDVGKELQGEVFDVAGESSIESDPKKELLDKEKQELSAVLKGKLPKFLCVIMYVHRVECLAFNLSDYNFWISKNVSEM